ncbi:MAG: deaminase, partial [Prevotella sp.]
MEDDLKFMRMALNEAESAYEEGEVPIGCVVVSRGRII